MTAKIISSMEIAQHIREEIKQEVARLKEDYNIVPSLGTIMVGENPASMSYVIAKRKTSKELGYQLIQENQLESIKEEQLVKLVDYDANDEYIESGQTGCWNSMIKGRC